MAATSRAIGSHLKAVLPTEAPAAPAPGTRPTEETLKLGKIAQLGLWSIMLLLCAVAYARIPEVLTGLKDTLIGNFSAVTPLHGVLNIVLICNLVISMNMIVSIVVGTWGMQKAGAPKSFEMEFIQKILDKGSLPLLLTVAGEEIVARQAPYWVGMTLSGPRLAWILMVVLNAGWALYHLFNYADPAERQVVRILPQLLSGIFDAYMYLRFGIVVGVFAHLMFDVILLSDQKEQLPLKRTRFIVIYYLVATLILGVVLLLEGTSLRVLGQWFNSYNFSKFEGFGFGQYALMILFLSAVANLIAEGLMFDDSDPSSVEDYNPLLQLLSVPLTIGILLGLNWVLTYFGVGQVGDRILSIALINVIIARTSSGSALAKHMVVSTPWIVVTVTVATVLGFWSAVWIYLLVEVLEFAPDLYEYMVRKQLVAE